MSLIDFLSPVDKKAFAPKAGFDNSQLGFHIQSYSGELPDAEKDYPHLAILGVEDDRGAVGNEGSALAPDYFRRHFYQLYPGDYPVQIMDFGNIRPGERLKDTYVALKTVVGELIRKNILPVIIGGGQDLTYAQYLAYEDLEQRVDLAVVDPAFDLTEDEEGAEATSSRSYLSRIMLHEPNYLFNFSNVGYQTYYVSQESLRVLDKLYFDAYRLGMISRQTEQAEPALRNADLLSFDMGAIRSSDLVANANASPNGFYGEEACQLCRYAGMSDKLSSVGFYELNPAYDQNGQSSALLAQMVWCFMDGFYNRKKDVPLQPKSSYLLYRTSLSGQDHELVFVKSKKTGRWWMQVPYPNTKSVNERFHMVPCSYQDYEQAMEGEMPDLWWRTFQKL